MSTIASLNSGTVTYPPISTKDAELSALAADGLGELLVAMEALAQSSIELSQQTVKGKRSELHDKLEDFLRELAKACEPQPEESSGFFGDLFGAVGDALGQLLGTLADFLVDAAKMPLTVGEAVVENWGDTSAMLHALAQSQEQLLQNGATAEDVRGFSEGVSRFGGELLEFTHKYPIDLASGAIRGDGRAAREDLAKLWGNFKRDVLENPHFWAVVGATAKLAAVAATVMSGGALMPLALGLFIALEADSQFKILDRLCPEAAPWLRLGLGLAAAGTCMLGGSGGATLTWLRTSAGLLNGATQVATGYNAIVNADAAADELEQQASLTNKLNQMHRLQRCISAVLEQLDSDNKDRTKTLQLGAHLVQLQGQANAAAVIRG